MTFSVALFDNLSSETRLKKHKINASRSDVAGRYAQMRDTTRVHERALFVTPRIPSELELQARWFAGDFGREFVSTNGDQIEIVQFGVWNREAGPDFRDAAIRINGSEPIHGSIEIDLLDRSWESHGHATNNLKAEGASVVICGTEQNKVDAALAELRKTGGSVTGTVADVSDPEAVRRLFAFADEHAKTTSMLVNNAGIGIFRPVGEITPEEWRRVLGINLDGAYYCTREACRECGRPAGGRS